MIQIQKEAGFNTVETENMKHIQCDNFKVLNNLKGAGSFHIHRKTMKDLWILAVLGDRDPFWSFHTKLDFLPRKHKVLLGQNDLEQKIKLFVK